MIAWLLAGCADVVPGEAPFWGCLALREGACLPSGEGTWVDLDGAVPVVDGEVDVGGRTATFPTLDTLGGVSAERWGAWDRAERAEDARAAWAEVDSLSTDAEATRLLLAARLAARVGFQEDDADERGAWLRRAAEQAHAGWLEARASQQEREALELAVLLATVLRELGERGVVPPPAASAAESDAWAEIEATSWGPDRADLRPGAVAAYVRALLAHDDGRLVEALAHLEPWAGIGARFPEARRARNLDQLRADLLGLVGRRGEGLDLHASIAADPRADRCEALTAWGWAQRDALEAGWDADRVRGGPDGAGPEATFAAVLADPACAGDRVNQAVNLALAELLAGRGEAALAALTGLDEAARAPGTPEAVRAWYLLALARARAATGDAAGAATAVDELLADPPLATGGASTAWRAALIGGALALARGDRAGALARYEQAGALYRTWTLWVPAAHGVDQVMSEWDPHARRHVALLLTEGRVADAFTVFRELRRSAVARSWLGVRAGRAGAAWARVRGAWTANRAALSELGRQARGATVPERRRLEAEEARLEEAAARLLALTMAVDSAPSLPLRSPSPGELWLGWMELDDGWVGFAARLGAEGAPEVTSARLGRAPTPDAWLAPFDRWIADAALVVVLPYGARRDDDLGELPWRGAPLLDARPVVTTLDLPPDPEPAPGPPSALVVADPSHTLAKAPEEAALVEAWARARGLAPAPTGAFEPAGRRLLHFSGHATSATTATSPATSRLVGPVVGMVRGGLLLEGGRAWGPAEALLLDGPAPPWVYLSACGSAGAPRADVEGVGLAQAFLVAGARQVVATIRPVRDDEALAFSRAFYGADCRTCGFFDDRRRTAIEFQRAAREARRAGGDVSPFRLFIP